MKKFLSLFFALALAGTVFSQQNQLDTRANDLKSQVVNTYDVEPLKAKRVRIVKTGLTVPVYGIEWAQAGDTIMIRLSKIEISTKKVTISETGTKSQPIDNLAPLWLSAIGTENEGEYTKEEQSGILQTTTIRKAVVLK